MVVVVVVRECRSDKRVCVKHLLFVVLVLAGVFPSSGDLEHLVVVSSSLCLAWIKLVRR